MVRSHFVCCCHHHSGCCCRHHHSGCCCYHHHVCCCCDYHCEDLACWTFIITTVVANGTVHHLLLFELFRYSCTFSSWCLLSGRSTVENLFNITHLREICTYTLHLDKRTLATYSWEQYQGCPILEIKRLRDFCQNDTEKSQKSPSSNRIPYNCGSWPTVNFYTINVCGSK